MKNLVKRLVVVLVFLVIASFLISCNKQYDIKYAYEPGDLRVIFNDTEITRNTAKLPHVAKIIDNKVFLSSDTVDILFDKDLYYEKNHDMYITSENDNIAYMQVGSNELLINDETKFINKPLFRENYEYINDDRYEGKSDTKEIVYIPIEDIKDIYDIDILYNDKIIISNNNKDRYRIYVNSDETIDVKYNKELDSITVDKLNPGDYFEVFTSSNDASNSYIYGRTSNGELGYISLDLFESHDIQNVTKVVEKTSNNEFVKIGFDYINEYANSVTEMISKRKTNPKVNILAPLMVHLNSSSGDLLYSENALSEYSNYVKREGKKSWLVLNNLFDKKENNELTKLDKMQVFLRELDYRNKVIDKVISLAKIYNFDGVSVDFENIYKEDAIHFTEFIKEFCIKGRKQGLVMTVCVNVPDGSDTWSLCYEHKTLSEIADYMIVMTYEQNMSNPGPNSSCEWVENNIEKLLNRYNVDPNKLVIGIPLYTVTWSKDKDGKVSRNVIYMTGGKRYLQDYYKNNLTWLEEDKTYFYQASDDSFRAYIEEERSANEKILLSKEYSLAGYSYWRLDMETDDFWSKIEE